MRILLASFIPNNEHTGMGKWTHCMARALRERGHDVTLWFAEDFPWVRRTGRFAFLVFPIVLAKRLFAARARFDVVVVHEPGGLVYACLRRALSSLPPMVLMCHNVESKVFRIMQEAGRRGFAHARPWSRLTVPLLRLPLSDGAIKLADHVVCLSAEDAGYVTSTLGRAGCDVTRNTNGVSDEHFVTNGTREPAGRVLFVGGWLDVKGRRLLPGIWEVVRARVPEARLSIAGAAWFGSAIREDFPAGARESVSVLKTAATPLEMTSIYRAHDVFLMPSLTEATSLAMLEAMAAGVPVVAARTGGLPDVVTDGVDGLLFPPYAVGEAAEQVIRLLTDTALADRIGRRGRERARTLSWGASAATLERAIEAALATQIRRAERP
jgi:glycosyltransferase involved in cell wall biosynthesis